MNMQYRNPVVKGFYPDPSVCAAEGKFYLINSSFQYFPGVPLWESEDLVNWTQIGHVLTKKEQVELAHVESSGGVYAPTIRYNNGRFYMVTTNNTTHRNFYVYTDDIHGEWSEAITVAQDGIDPSLFFEDGHAYFMSNGTDDEGVQGVVQAEIDIETGKKISGSKCIWHGTGGRFLESPHMYRIGEYYYLMAAEGGTEYGHMITYGRSKSVWGPFENAPVNPVLTNRNKAPFRIQGIGHGDLVQGPDGNWYIISLGFRQIDTWLLNHHLGREVFLTPVYFREDGWFTAGVNGTTDFTYEIPIAGEQKEKTIYTFENTDWNIDWCYMRHPDYANYDLKENCAVLKGCATTIDEAKSPTFIAMRQKDFVGRIECKLKLDATATGGEAGLTLYQTELEHYDIAIRRTESGNAVVVKLHIGEAKFLHSVTPIAGDSAEVIIDSTSLWYTFKLRENGEERELAKAQARYLSTEVAGGFTGVMIGLYAQGDVTGCFTDYRYEYVPETTDKF